MAISLNLIRENVRKIATLTGLDGLATGSNLMYTVPAGRTLVVVGIYPRVTAGVGVTVDGTVSAGTSGAFDQIIPTTSTTNMRAVDETYALPVSAQAKIVPAGAGVTFKRVTGATGTTLTYDVDLVGYEI